MTKFETHGIGIDLEDLRLPVKSALHRAAELDFRKIELPVGAGEVTPENLSESGRRHLRQFVRGLGLEVCSLGAGLSALPLIDPARVDERVARTCRAIDLAWSLGTSLVTDAAGALTHPETGEPNEQAVEALAHVADYADRRGVLYALRPSRDTAEKLHRVLSRIGCPALSIGLDPAAMVMAGVTPIPIAERFPERIALFHARDATAGSRDQAGHETRLGEGQVDLRGLLNLLREAEFRGAFLTRRADAQNPEPDLLHARTWLTSILA